MGGFTEQNNTGIPYFFQQDIQILLIAKGVIGDPETNLLLVVQLAKTPIAFTAEQRRQENNPTTCKKDIHSIAVWATARCS